MIALRAMLPDDRLVDLAQIPGALLGGLAIAGHRAAMRGRARDGARRRRLRGSSCPPCSCRCRPTTSTSRARRSSCRPSTSCCRRRARRTVLPRSAQGARPRRARPGPLSRLEAERAPVRRRRRRAPPLGGPADARAPAPLLVALLLVALGSETFVLNALRYGNPVWPVEVHIGPIVLHGKTTMQHLLDSGAAAPHLHGPAPLAQSSGRGPRSRRPPSSTCASAVSARSCSRPRPPRS